MAALLPDGWSECLDAQGQPYYWHAATNESTWTHPGSVSARFSRMWKSVSSPKPPPASGAPVVSASDRALAEGRDAARADAEVDASAGAALAELLDSELERLRPKAVGGAGAAAAEVVQPGDRDSLAAGLAEHSSRIASLEAALGAAREAAAGALAEAASDAPAREAAEGCVALVAAAREAAETSNLSGAVVTALREKAALLEREGERRRHLEDRLAAANAELATMTAAVASLTAAAAADGTVPEPTEGELAALGIEPSLHCLLKACPWTNEALEACVVAQAAFEWQSWSIFEQWSAIPAYLPEPLQTLLLTTSLPGPDHAHDEEGRPFRAVTDPRARRRVSMEGTGGLPGTAWEWVAGWRVDLEAAYSDGDGWTYGYDAEALLADEAAPPKGKGVSSHDGAGADRLPIRRVRRRVWRRSRLLARAPEACGEAAQVALKLRSRVSSLQVLCAKLSDQVLSTQLKLVDAESHAAEVPALLVQLDAAGKALADARAKLADGTADLASENDAQMARAGFGPSGAAAAAATEARRSPSPGIVPIPESCGVDEASAPVSTGLAAALNDNLWVGWMAAAARTQSKSGDDELGDAPLLGGGAVDWSLEAPPSVSPPPPPPPPTRAGTATDAQLAEALDLPTRPPVTVRPERLPSADEQDEWDAI